ncbi:RimJ/RimL family protein N-acetyltransferase [Catenulispora sp. GP43]|uniref:GNAT family N-acetyltransferase n=1 Tax=Catenulispora sp. GP43 TaxID=3156263 RepID=UPI0035186BE0
MADEQLLTAARQLWTDIAAAPVAFPDRGVSVVASPRSGICPAGWIGLVLLGDSGIGTAPDQVSADEIGARLADHTPQSLYDPANAAQALPAAEMIGPVTLAYLAADRFRPFPGPTVEQLPVDHPDLRALEQRCTPEERAEVSIGQLTSPAFGIRDCGEIIAAAGYVAWPRRTAHMAILTAPRARGRGLAKVAASSAIEHALTAGMVPQWRARVPASLRVAEALGFAEVGVQIRARLG